MEDEILLLKEYEHFSDMFWKNEELGEKRFNFFITLATAILGATAALYSTDKLNDNLPVFFSIATGALAIISILGLFTFFRMIRRNRVTDEYKKIIKYLRKNLKQHAKHLQEYDLPFLPPKHSFIRGSLAETVAVINSFCLSAVAIIWLNNNYRLIGAIAVFILSFIPQELFARKRNHLYRTQSFRAGVGAIIINDKKKVLAFERRDLPGNWQCPQGGLEIGEAPIEGAYREIEEETGIKKEKLQQVFDEPLLLAYELPPKYRSKKVGRGQAQYWFLFRFTGEKNDITLGEKKEFQDHQWMDFPKLTKKVIWFKKPVYLQLEKYLSDQLKIKK